MLRFDAAASPLLRCCFAAASPLLRLRSPPLRFHVWWIFSSVFRRRDVLHAGRLLRRAASSLCSSRSGRLSAASSFAQILSFMGHRTRFRRIRVVASPSHVRAASAEVFVSFRLGVIASTVFCRRCISFVSCSSTIRRFVPSLSPQRVGSPASSSASSSAFSAFLLRRVRWYAPLGLLTSWMVLRVALDFVFCGFYASRGSSRRPSSLSPSMGCVFRRHCAAGIDMCDFRLGCLHPWRRFGVRPARWWLEARARTFFRHFLWTSVASVAL